MSARALYSADHVAAGSSGPDGLPEAGASVPSMPLGRRAFIAGATGVAVATTLGSTAHAAVPSGASYFEPVDPVRLADTRTEAPYTNVAKNFERRSDRWIRINIHNSPYVAVPSDAIAVVVSIAAVFNGQPGWVKAVPAGTTDRVSNINMEAGDGPVANLATVKIGAGGKIDVLGKNPYNVVVDILGIYRSTSVAVRPGRMQFLPATARALSDTRMQDGQWRTVLMDSYVPASAQAVVVNLTVAGCRANGYLTAAAVRTVDRPKVSNLNFVAGDTRAAGAIVKLGRSGAKPSIEVFCRGDAQVFVDVTGYFTGPTSETSDQGLFVPINPIRLMDTRRKLDSNRTGKKRLWPKWSRAFELPNSVSGFGPKGQMAGVVFNATLVGAMGYGYVTVLPARTARGKVSNLNATRPGHVVANHVIARASTFGIEMFCFCGGDLIADVAGWFTGVPQPTSLPAPVDPPAPPSGFNWRLSVPAMRGPSVPNGLQNWVLPNLQSGDPVVDSGNTWHWTNTGFLGNVGASIVTFGHRTSHGGPNRYQHVLVSGDEMILDTPDQRRFRYRFMKETITNSSATQILNAARGNATGSTFSLVACTGSRTVPNDQPLGSVTFRLVSTFQLTGWTDERVQSDDV